MSEHATPVRTRSLAPDLDWISTCHENESGVAADAHTHVAQYLVETDDGTVLVDAGAGHGESLVGTVRDLTDGDGLDAVLLTHAILPHTGNVDVLREAFDDPMVVSTSPIPAAIGVEGAQPTVINDTDTVAGDEFTFIDPVLTDVVVSTWIYHHASGTLFTAEGVGHYHDPGECDYVSGDYADGVPHEHVHDFAADKLQFLEYVDPAKLEIAFETLRSEYDIERIAPIHGAPIKRPGIDNYVETLLDVTGEIEPS